MIQGNSKNWVCIQKCLFFRQSVAQEFAENKIDSEEADDSKLANADDQVSNRMQRLNLYFEKENVRKNCVIFA